MTLDPQDVCVRGLGGFDAIGRDQWGDLWARSETPSIFSHFDWVSSWCHTQAESKAVKIYAASSGDRLVALIPTVRLPQQRTVVLAGDEHADFAAILIDRSLASSIGSILEMIAQEIPMGTRWVLRDVRSDTRAASMLGDLARAATSQWRMVEGVPAPRAVLSPDHVRAVLNKRSLKRHSRDLAKLGSVAVGHFTNAADILPKLDQFFLQHISRWRDTKYPSLFKKRSNRLFYIELAKRFSGTGRVVYSTVTLNGHLVAAHYGFVSEGDLIWYKPTFDPEFARHSPGEVLMLELFKFAEMRGLRAIDFTRGDEAFKRRFCNQVRATQTYVRYENRAAAISARAISAAKKIAKRLKLKLAAVR